MPDAALWLDWICDTRLNHQVNPVLMRFRSPSSRRHWVTTTLAVLDAAALRVSLDPDHADPVLVQLIMEGTLTFATLLDAARETAPDATRHNWETERAILVAVRRPARGKAAADAGGAGPVANDASHRVPTCGVSAAEFTGGLEVLRACGVSAALPDGRIWATVRGDPSRLLPGRRATRDPAACGAGAVVRQA